MESTIPPEVNGSSVSEENSPKTEPYQGPAGVPRSDHTPMMQQRIHLGGNRVATETYAGSYAKRLPCSDVSTCSRS